MTFSSDQVDGSQVPYVDVNLTGFVVNFWAPVEMFSFQIVVF